MHFILCKLYFCEVVGGRSVASKVANTPPMRTGSTPTSFLRVPLPAGVKGCLAVLGISFCRPLSWPLSYPHLSPNTLERTWGRRLCLTHLSVLSCISRWALHIVVLSKYLFAGLNFHDFKCYLNSYGWQYNKELRQTFKWTNAALWSFIFKVHLPPPGPFIMFYSCKERGESWKEGQVKCEKLLKKEFLQVLFIITVPWKTEREEQKSSFVINDKPHGNKWKREVAMLYQPLSVYL